MPLKSAMTQQAGRRGKYPVYCIFAAVMTLLLLNGCSWLVKPPRSDVPARQWTDRWDSQNRDIKSFKALMRVRIQSHDDILSGRAAVAAVLPDKLRIEWLSIVGRPLFRLAADGQTIYMLRMADRKVYHTRQNSSALSRIIHMPLGVASFLSVLMGRPPLPAFEAAQQIEVPGPACAVALKSRWDNVVARLESPTCGLVQSMQTLGSNGVPEFTIHWQAWQTMDGHTVPQKIQLVSAQGDQVNIAIERIWLDVAVPPSTFIIAPAE